MLVYNHTFKFREPYQVLVDDQLVLDCYKSSFDLVKGLKRTLQAEVKVMITQCCMQALYAYGNQEAIDIAKGFERRRCNHPPKDPLPPQKCLNDVVNVNGNNKHRYVVASQDLNIRRSLRKIPGVPLIHLSRSVMVMEPLSDASARISAKVEESKLFKGLNDPKVGSLDTSTNDKSMISKVLKKGKKGPSCPNPLSMKKKTVKDISRKENGSAKRKIETVDNEIKTDSQVMIKSKRRRKHKSGTKNDAGQGSSGSYGSNGIEA